jgi:hypothetical protein
MREPEEIVGTTRAQAAARRFVPPVLDVALDELPGRSAQQMLAREIGPREQQRHHVLQLIAKPERAAGLVVPAACPEATAHGLIEQPAIEQEINESSGVSTCTALSVGPMSLRAHGPQRGVHLTVRRSVPGVVAIVRAQ